MFAPAFPASVKFNWPHRSLLNYRNRKKWKLIYLLLLAILFDDFVLQDEFSQLKQLNNKETYLKQDENIQPQFISLLFIYSPRNDISYTTTDNSRHKAVFTAHD